MNLSAYLAATNQLLQNPVPSTPLYTTADLTNWINEGRQQLAGETECIRATSVSALSAQQQIYPYSTFNQFGYDSSATGTITFPVNPSNGNTVTLNGIVWTFVTGTAVGNQIHIEGTVAVTVTSLRNALNLSADPALTVARYTSANNVLTVSYKTVGTGGEAYTLAASAATVSASHLTGGFTDIEGISSVVTIRQLWLTVSGASDKNYLINNRSWPWFVRYCIATGSAQSNGVPTTWAQLGRGSLGTFGVSPLPTLAYALTADVACLPIDLVTDADVEAIPEPFTTAVPYYAAYRAYLSSQKQDPATVMYQRYMNFAQKAMQETTSTVLPLNQPGGPGARMVGSKGPVTQQPPQRGG